MTPADSATATHKQIPGIDLPVSGVALGCMSIVASETYGGVGKDEAIQTVNTAYEEGITLFDTAPAYGNGESEDLVGQALEGKRDRVIIATKASGQTLSAQEIAEDCDVSLKRLRTDYIDLYQIHWNRRKVPAEETLRAMEQLVKSGKVRSLGVCNYGPIDLGEALSYVKLQTNQVAYNMLFRAVEFEITSICLDQGVGLLCYSPLAQGLLTGRYLHADDVPAGRQRTRHFSGERELARHGQPGCEEETFDAVAQVKKICEELGAPMSDVALAWCLHKPAVLSVLAGASKPEQVKQNVAASKFKLSPDIMERLDAATAKVKSLLGPGLDLWSGESRTR